MGFLSWLFGWDKLPPRAAGFGSPDLFEAFIDAVIEALSKAGQPVTRKQVRSGAVSTRGGDGDDREIDLDELARRCAAIPMAEWSEVIATRVNPATGGRGGVGAQASADDEELVALDSAPPTVTPYSWGGVVFAGEGAHGLACVFPVSELSVYEALPSAVQAVEALLVFNHTEAGVLAGSRIARQWGVDTVLVTDPERPMDRGVEEGEPLEGAPVGEQRDWPGLSLTALAEHGLEHEHEHEQIFRITFRSGQETAYAVVGCGVRYDALALAPHPTVVAGTMDHEGEMPAEIAEVMLDLEHAYFVEDGDGAASAQVDAFSLLEIPATLLGIPR